MANPDKEPPGIYAERLSLCHTCHIIAQFVACDTSGVFSWCGFILRAAKTAL